MTIIMNVWSHWNYQNYLHICKLLKENMSARLDIRLLLKNAEIPVYGSYSVQQSFKIVKNGLKITALEKIFLIDIQFSTI